MEVVYDLPKRFVRIHKSLIDAALGRQLPFLNFMLIEPLGGVRELTSDLPDVIEVLTLKIECAHRRYSMEDSAVICVVSAASPRSKELIDDWVERHEHATDEQLRWTP